MFGAEPIFEIKEAKQNNRWQRIEAAAVAIAGGIASGRRYPFSAIQADSSRIVETAELIISEIDRRRAESREG